MSKIQRLDRHTATVTIASQNLAKLAVKAAVTAISKSSSR
jgi:hypothetical protein